MELQQRPCCQKRHLSQFEDRYFCFLLKALQRQLGGKLQQRCQLKISLMQRTKYLPKGQLVSKKFQFQSDKQSLKMIVRFCLINELPVGQKPRKIKIQQRHRRLFHRK